MVYIESHQQLAVHPKTKKLARLLKLSRPAVIGHLHCLWWWAMDFAKDGDVSSYGPDIVADGAMWEEDAGAFIDALVECAVTTDGYGFLERHEDGRLLIHDWQNYGGKLVGKRETDAERKRREREEGKTTPAPSKQAASPKQTVQPSGTPVSSGALPASSGNPSDSADTSSPSFLCPPDVPRTAQVEQQRQTKTNKTEQSEDNNNTEERSVEERGLLEEASPAPEARVVVASLREIGVSEQMSEEMVRVRDPGYVQKQIDWLPWRIKEREGTTKAVRDPAALLVKAIQEGWAVPASCAQAKTKDAEQRLRSEQSERRSAETREREQAEQRTKDAGAAKLQEFREALSPEEQKAVIVEATQRFRQQFPVHVKKLDKANGDPEHLPPGPKVQWEQLRDAVLLERGVANAGIGGLV